MRGRNLSFWTAALLGIMLVVPAKAQYDRAQSGGDFPLPVFLLGFSAAGGENSVVLRWKTASEIDLAGFNLYRSLGQDGIYARINPVLIPAQGTSTQDQDYQYIDDDNLLQGFHYYYKLATVEITGRESVQEPAILGIAGSSQETSWSQPPDFSQLTYLQLNGNYPDPFNGETLVSFSVYEQSQVQLEVYTLAGRKVATLAAGYLQPGEYTRAFRGDLLPSGVYLYRLRGEKGFDTVRKMVLLR